jgi:hypothetical protein
MKQLEEIAKTAMAAQHGTTAQSAVIRRPPRSRQHIRPGTQCCSGGVALHTASRDCSEYFVQPSRKGKEAVSDGHLCVSTTNADMHKLENHNSNETARICCVMSSIKDVQSVADTPNAFIQWKLWNHALRRGSKAAIAVT